LSLPARGTKTLYLQVVALDTIAVFLGQLLFQAMEEQIFKFLDFSAP
jgi:hypothetical protein